MEACFTKFNQPTGKDTLNLSYEYDDLGRKIHTYYPEIEDPNNPGTFIENSTTSDFDLYGNVKLYVKSLDTADKTQSFFSHDDAGRVLTDDSPDRGIIDYAYDLANGTVSKRQSGGSKSGNGSRERVIH